MRLPLPFCSASPRLLPALLATTLIATAGGARAAAPDVEVTMRRVNGHPQFDIRAEVSARASVARAWQVLTGYDRLAGFIPNLASSVELPLPDAAPGEHLVEQHGFGKFLFIRQPIDLVLRVREQPMESIDMTLQSGNMRQYHARWELTGRQADDGGDGGNGARVTLRYTGLIAPDFYVPGLFGNALMRRDLGNMLAAVVAEMEKPGDTGSPPDGPQAK